MANEHETMVSIELKSRNYVKRVVIPSDSEDKVLIEGFLGELKELSVTEGIMIEIRGANGVLRMDLKEEELKKLFQPSNYETEKPQEEQP